MKYILITGGVISGIGKGITASSIGLLLKSSGLTVTAIKIDPYLNVDAGTMSPYEHGEVFVLADGGECDLDLGNYERFLDINLTRDHNITTGKIYSAVIARERRGDYLGQTVQVVPHITNAVIEWIERVAAIAVDGATRHPDVCVIELGGTVGDIESTAFLEALRQLCFKVGRANFAHVHVSLVPMAGAEAKTKPTQRSVRELRAVGLFPDLIVCRSVFSLSAAIVQKIAAFAMVPAVSIYDASSIYHVPALLQEQGVPAILCHVLEIENKQLSAAAAANVWWRRFLVIQEDKVHIALVGKYTKLSDAYFSVLKAVHHAANKIGAYATIEWISADLLEQRDVAEWKRLRGADGILVTGGFGMRGVEGKILAAEWARENRRPFLGICLGFQVAVIEFARNVLGWEGANSTEFDATTANPVVVLAPDGAMRLGAHRTRLQPYMQLYELYGRELEISERYRHRYEVDPSIIPALKRAGLVVNSNTRADAIELYLNAHPFYVATQFHPEFQSRPARPSPPFLGFVKASLKSNI